MSTFYDINTVKRNSIEHMLTNLTEFFIKFWSGEDRNGNPSNWDQYTKTIHDCRLPMGIPDFVAMAEYEGLNVYILRVGLEFQQVFIYYNLSKPEDEENPSSDVFIIITGTIWKAGSEIHRWKACGREI